jgi:hypothetical protein
MRLAQCGSYFALCACASLLVACSNATTKSTGPKPNSDALTRAADTRGSEDHVLPSWATESLPSGAVAAGVRPVSNYTSFTVTYLVVLGSQETPLLTSGFGLKDTSVEITRQFDHEIHYAQRFDRPGRERKAVGTVVWSKAEPQQYIAPLWPPIKWDVESRTAILNGVPVVSPAILPGRTERIRFVTGRVIEGQAENVVMQISQRQTAFVKPTNEFAGFVECWEYQAIGSSAGKLLPTIWADKKTGLILAGIGDFRGFSGKVDRLVWALERVTGGN